MGWRGPTLPTTPVTLSRTALGTCFAGFLLMGAVGAAYGPMLGYLQRRYDVGLSTAGAVLGVNFAGGLAGALMTVVGLERLPGRRVLSAGFLALVVGLLGVALAPTWPALLAAVLATGAGFGSLDFGINQLLAHSELPRRAAMFNLLHAQFGLGAVAGPLLVVAAGDRHLPILLAALAVVPLVSAVGLRGLAGGPVRESVEQPPARIGGRALVGLLVVAYVLYVGVETGIGGWAPTHLVAVGYSEEVAAGSTSVFWAALAVGRLLAAPLAARVAPERIVLACAATAVATLLLAAAGPAAPYAYLLTGLAVAPIYPTGIAWLAGALPGRPRTTSWLLVSAMLGGVVVPPLVGLAINGFGAQATPLVLTAAATAGLAAFTAATIVGRRDRRDAVLEDFPHGPRP